MKRRTVANVTPRRTLTDHSPRRKSSFQRSRNGPRRRYFAGKQPIRGGQLRDHRGHRRSVLVPGDRHNLPRQNFPSQNFLGQNFPAAGSAASRTGRRGARHCGRLPIPPAVGSYSRPRVLGRSGLVEGALGKRWVSGGRDARAGRGCGAKSASADVTLPRGAAALDAGRGADRRTASGPRDLSRPFGEGGRELIGRATDWGSDGDSGGVSRSSNGGSLSERNRTNGEIASASSAREWKARKS